MFYTINRNCWLKDECHRMSGEVEGYYEADYNVATEFFVGLVDSKKCGLTPGLSFNYKIISTETENIP